MTKRDKAMIAMAIVRTVGAILSSVVSALVLYKLYHR